MKEYLEKIFTDASLKLDYLKAYDVSFSVPPIQDHGDYSTNIAMLLAKNLKKNPRMIAQQIIENLEYDNSILGRVEVAGAGFINFFFTKSYISEYTGTILKEKEHFGRSDLFDGRKSLVEFVSANPTGPLTIGHGRNAVIGDTIANMLEWAGCAVDREYYFNNAGRQMRVLGDSVKLRYRELLGDKIEFPDDYYQGEYIIEIAKKILGDPDKPENFMEDENYFKKYAEKEIFRDIKTSLNKIGITFDSFFNENTLYEDGDIKEVLESLSDLNLSYQMEGAVWFKLTELGGEQDKVIVKSTGEPTYRLPDIAYHKRKFQRGYDLIVDLFGSDHSATFPDVLAGISALGFAKEKIKVLIHQFVTVTEKGEIVKMSTRKANFITLDELIDQVGPDVVRYFFIMRNMSSHLNFDLEIAKKQSDENPVFYLQYAHARICSILKMTEEQELKASLDNLNLLQKDEEQNLLKKLAQFKDELAYSTLNFEPHRISSYLEDLASLFHRFYTECRIIGSERDLAEARIALCKAVKIVIKNGLNILGINAPERM